MLFIFGKKLTINTKYRTVLHDTTNILVHFPLDAGHLLIERRPEGLIEWCGVMGIN